MTEITKSEIVENYIKTLVEKIARRTSESYAVATLHDILKRLTPKYEFLKHIEINRTFYSEGIDAVTVYPDVNYITSDTFYNALNEILSHTVQHLEKNADYFFIKEFQEAIEKGHPSLLDEIKTNLDLMQTKYIKKSQEEQKDNNKEITEQIITTISSLLNTILSEIEVINILNVVLSKLKPKYNFLQLITIHNTAKNEGFYTITVAEKIQTIKANELGQGLQSFIQETVNNIEWKGEESFIESLKKQFSNEQTQIMQKMGINLDHIQLLVQQKKHEQIMKKSLEALIKIIGEKTSISFATLTIKEIINQLLETHNILKYIKIETTTTNTQDPNAIVISSDINNVDSYVVGRAIRDIIQNTGHNLGDKTQNFIQRFKEEIGEEYLTDIEKIGVNLQFLELKFA